MTGSSFPAMPNRLAACSRSANRRLRLIKRRAFLICGKSKIAGSIRSVRARTSRKRYCSKADSSSVRYCFGSITPLYRAKVGYYLRRPLIALRLVKSSHDDIAAIPNDFRAPNHPLNARQLPFARHPARRQVIEFLDIAEIQTGTLFQIGDPDLGSRYVESFLEAWQILDVFLSEHESSG